MLIEDEERSALHHESFMDDFQTRATEANENPNQDGKAGNQNEGA